MPGSALRPGGRGHQLRRPGSFNPSLEVGLNVNTVGVKHTAELCLKLGVPMVHVSTAFVAGNRSGLVFEDEEVKGYFPKKDA